MSVNIPLDIVQIILLKLPVKSLLRCKTVCKSWNSIISDYEFAKNHHRQSKTSRNQNTFLLKPSASRDQEYRLVKFENGEFQVEAIEEHPYSGKLLCCADGLALLSTSNPTSHLLWNLSTKQKMIIPCRYWITYGFCRGQTLDDYKIIGRRMGYYAIYSCKNKAWTESKEFPYCIDECTKGGIFIDGFCFWAMDVIDEHKKEIFYFDPRDETFNKLKKPREIEMEGVGKDFFLTSLKGCLCLYDNMRPITQKRRVRIWILRDTYNIVDSSSWSELMIINMDVVHGLEPWKMMTPLFFTEKNEVVICWELYGEMVFVLYNSMDDKFEKIEVSRSSLFSRFAVGGPCLDSMLFPAT